MTTSTAATAAEPVVTPVVETPVAAHVVAPVAVEPIVIGTPVVEASVAAAAPVADASGVIAYEPTGDAGLDVALTFVGNLGIPVDHPAMQATANGDFSIIKAHLATLGAKAQGWEQMVALAEASYTRQEAAATAKTTAVSNAVHAVAGGPENWAKVSAFASANGTPEEKAELNAMFAAGPVSARAAAQMLVTLYEKSPGAVVVPASAVTNPGGGREQNSTGSMSGREYSDAVNALARKVGSHNLHAHPEYAALGKRLSVRS